jgi:hypothetical protein
MEKNPVLAANVAHLLLRSLFERRPHLRDTVAINEGAEQQSPSDANYKMAGPSGKRRRVIEESSRTDENAAAIAKDPGGVGAASASSYAFAVASGGPDMLRQLFARQDGTPLLAGLEFFRLSNRAARDSCKKLWDGAGLFVKLPNGVCTSVPTPESFAKGSLVSSAETIMLSEDRRRIVQELAIYQARLDANPQERAVLDLWLFSKNSAD